jgi:hypothetical protein
MAASGRWFWFALLLLPAFVAGAGLAQTGMPGTDIYLAELQYKDGMVEVGKPGNVTRRPGYDNQPSFVASVIRIFYTSYREDGQSDIVIYDHETGRTLGFRATGQSEYSAMLTPAATHVSVVRVEEDSTQRLWQFPNQGGDPEVLLEDRPGVGYYAWGNDSTVVLFILGTPNEMHIGNVRSGVTEHITDDIGRSLHKIPGRNAISFSQPVTDNKWWIKSLDLETRDIQPIVAAIPESQDYAWTPGGILLMAKGSTLYQWNPKVSTEWQEIADLSQYSITGITRLAVSADGWYLALVAEE